MIAMVFSFAVSIILWKSSTKLQENRVMSILLLLVAISLIEPIANTHELYRIFPHYFAFTEFFPFLYGPLYFAYIELLLFRKPLKPSYGFHFIPFAVAVLSNYQFYLLGFAEKIDTAEQLLIGIGSPIIVDYSELMIVTFSLYLSVTLFKLHRYREKLKQVLAERMKYNLSWLYVSTILLLLALMSSIFWVLGSRQMPANYFQLQAIFNAFAISAVGCFSLSGVVVFRFIQETGDSTLQSIEGIVANEVVEKANHEVLQLIADRTIEKLISSQIYLDPELNLYKLAELIEVKPYLLSKSINNILRCSFGELINEQRVKHFVELIRIQPKGTIESHMYDSGFQNKSTFYKAFKKFFHVTPKQYISQIY